MLSRCQLHSNCGLNRTLVNTRRYVTLVEVFLGDLNSLIRSVGFYFDFMLFMG